MAAVFYNLSGFAGVYEWWLYRGRSNKNGRRC